MLTPGAAEGLIQESMPLFHREECSIGEAHGRILRADVRADRDLPPFDRVMMDGYALRSSSVAGGVRRFRVEAVQAAGTAALSLGVGDDACVEIMTGAVLASGADCVVPYEETTREGDFVELRESFKASAGTFIHRRASDHRQGDIVVAAGLRLKGGHVAAAAACGCTKVTVSAAPRIAVVATGDELVAADEPVLPHQLRRSNDYALGAALKGAGYPLVERFHLRDDRRHIEDMLRHILAQFDVVLLTGGVSKGKFDYIPGELERQAVRKVFQGVAQRPGKPFWFGLSPRNRPVFALPGNPVSAFTCLHRYVIGALDRASGLNDFPVTYVRLTEEVRSLRSLAYLLPVRLKSEPDAMLAAEPAPVGSSGDLAGLLASDGFVELAAQEADFAQGHVAPFWRWL